MAELAADSIINQCECGVAQNHEHIAEGVISDRKNGIFTSFVTHRNAFQIGLGRQRLNKDKIQIPRATANWRLHRYVVQTLTVVVKRHSGWRGSVNGHLETEWRARDNCTEERKREKVTAIDTIDRLSKITTETFMDQWIMYILSRWCSLAS